KEAPIKALRAIFAGFGQVLLVADRARSRALEQDTAQDAEHQPPADQPVPAAAAQRPESKQPESKQPESKWRSLDETGNVRLLSDPDLADAGLAAAGTTGSAGAAGSGAEGAPAGRDPSGAAASPAGAPAAAASPASLPLRNYDELTFASLRARLRNLDT